MKRNVSVVRLIVATWGSGPPASQPVSCLTRLSADLSVIWLRVCFVLFVVCFVYQNKPRTIDALKPNITEEIQAVTADILARTFQNMTRRVQSCLDVNGGHFQHVAMSSHFLYNEVKSASNFVAISSLVVKLLTLRRLMSYIYIWSTHS